MENMWTERFGNLRLSSYMLKIHKQKENSRIDTIPLMQLYPLICIVFIGGSRGGGRARHTPPLQDPILSFSYTFSLKSAHIGGQNPPKWVHVPPYGKSWIRPWYSNIYDYEKCTTHFTCKETRHLISLLYFLEYYL